MSILDAKSSSVYWIRTIAQHLWKYYNGQIHLGTTICTTQLEHSFGLHSSYIVVFDENHSMYIQGLAVFLLRHINKSRKQTA